MATVITVTFDSLEEFEAFRTSGKATRGRKGKDEPEAPETGSQVGSTAGGNAPAPMQPPANDAPAQGFNPQPAFAPPGAGAAPQGGAFPAAAAPSGPAEIVALVNRINARIDGAIGSGQPADQVLSWFRGQCGPDAANYTLDQIKTVALPKLAQPALENIAKLMNA